jgi:hypothetical protein
MLYRKMMRLLANMRFRTYILASMRVLALALVGIGIVGLFLVIGDSPPALATLWKVPTSLVEAFWIYLLVTYWYFGAAAAIIALEVGLPLALLAALIRFLWKRA